MNDRHPAIAFSTKIQYRSRGIEKLSPRVDDTGQIDYPVVQKRRYTLEIPTQIAKGLKIEPGELVDVVVILKEKTAV